ncbi:hypothetical protein BN1723_016675, partial [Verticillium longisporum]
QHLHLLPTELWATSRTCRTAIRTLTLTSPLRTSLLLLARCKSLPRRPRRRTREAFTLPATAWVAARAPTETGSTAKIRNRRQRPTTARSRARRERRRTQASTGTF